MEKDEKKAVDSEEDNSKGIEAIANSIYDPFEDKKCWAKEIDPSDFSEINIKSGWKKSEFWVSLMFEIYTFVVVVPNSEIEWWIKFPLILAAILLMVYWIYSRSKLYNKDYKNKIVVEFAKKVKDFLRNSESASDIIDKLDIMIDDREVKTNLSKIISKIKKK